MGASLRSPTGLPPKKLKKVQWFPVPLSYGNPEITIRQLCKLYWAGIERDLDEILRTLNMWEDAATPPSARVQPEDWVGLEAFCRRATGLASDGSVAPEILAHLDTRDSEGFADKERIAQMLLRAAGMLDIDKMTEHRDPDYRLGQWLRPRASQLVAMLPEEAPRQMEFAPLKCSKCKVTIRGTYFRCIDGCACDKSSTGERPIVFCETCVRTCRFEFHLEDLRKVHKNCILSTCVSNAQAQTLCYCLEGVSEPAKERLFPFEHGQRSLHRSNCPLVQLKTEHCTAKKNELNDIGNLQGDESRGIADQFVKIVGKVAKVEAEIPYGNVHMSLMIGPLMIENGVEQSKQGVFFSVRDRLQLHPVATPRSSVHNCLALSKDRHLFSASEHLPRTRRMKAFMKQVVGSAFWGLTEDDRVQEAEIIQMVAEASSHYIEDISKSIDRNQEDLKSIRRPIYEKLHALLHLRAKAYIESIVDRLFDEKAPLKWHPRNNNCQRFCDNLINRSVFGSFMVYARDCKQEKHPSSQIFYLLSFVCRKGCHDGFPKKVTPLSRETAPNGHTEEFLLRYRQFDHHNDTDIIDSLVEYWTDWGGFREPIFQYQGLFPWDCTEARTQEEEDLQPQVKCGDCRLAKHLWAFPFDAWSVAQLHMFRERQFYTPSYNNSSQSSPQIGHDEWMENRLSVLEAFEVLGCIAVAMHRSAKFSASCQWNFKAHGVVFFNTARPWGLFLNNKRRSKLKKLERHGHGNLVPRAGSALMKHDRVKLAGIHRAQPFSHSYEHVQGHDCTLADWADAAHDCQVEAYKALRDSRSVGVDRIIENARSSSYAAQANVGPKALGTEGAFPSTDGAFVAEGLDGFGASVDFASGSLCDCMCDFTGLTGFEQAQDLGGWDFNDGGDGFSHDCDGGGVDGGWGGLDAGMDGGGGGGSGVDGGGGM